MYLTRTVTQLDPADLTLLVIVGTTEDGSARPTEEFAVKGKDGQEEPPYQRSTDVRIKELLDRWQAPRELLSPALASLEQAGVVERRLAYWGGGAATWALSGYGELFLNHVLVDLGGWPPRRQLKDR